MSLLYRDESYFVNPTFFSCRHKGIEVVVIESSIKYPYACHGLPPPCSFCRRFTVGLLGGWCVISDGLVWRESVSAQVYPNLKMPVSMPKLLVENAASMWSSKQ